jgi:hypothetical protein
MTEIAKHPNLSSLSLENTRITHSGLQELAKLKSLKFLSIKGTDVSRKDIEKLRKQLPACRIIH